MSKKILIVEDDEQIARLLMRQLEAGGYKALKAGNGEEGLKLAREERPDLAILDINLPLIDGTRLCELIKTDAATKDMKIIMLTGDHLVGDMEDSFTAGADAYMNKPYKLPNLLTHIKILIGS